MYEKKSTIRYRIRKRAPLLRENFFPWGLLGLALILLPLLYAVFWYAKNGIQNTVQSEIKKELAANNLEWVNVEVDGQAVMLTGEGSKQDGDRAISLAKGVENKAWLGHFSVPSKVNGQFSEPISEPIEIITEPIITEPELVEKSLEVKPNWGRLVSKFDSGILTLTGTVGSQQEKEILLGAANNKIDPPKLIKIVDELNVSDDSLISVSEILAKRVSELILLCSSGQSSSIDGVFSIECQSTLEQVENLNRLASTPIDGAQLGSIQISTVNDCNRSFAEILDGKSIRFSIGSANLKSSSSPLLIEIADLAKACSGLISVEGHTDKSGNLDSNMLLSEARAKSVVDALVELGVKRERLEPKGFGPNKPRAEGDDPVAYALNRRIEFHVSQ